jgi:hypothetical protein
MGPYLNSPRFPKRHRPSKAKAAFVALGRWTLILLLSPLWIPVLILFLPFLIREKYAAWKRSREAPLDPRPLRPPRPVDPELERRRAIGMRDKMGISLVDPVGKDPALDWVFREVSDRVEAEMGQEYRMGDCRRRWRRMKQILKDDYDIIWYSPPEMNPGVKYD